MASFRTHCRVLSRTIIVLAALLSSVSGQTVWEWKNPLPQGNPLYDISFGNNTYVAVGDAGKIQVSADGTVWETVDWGGSERLLAVAFADSQFVAAGTGGAIVRSVNGREWTADSSGTAEALVDIACQNNCFVAVGDAGTIVFSKNGTSWSPSPPLTSNNLTSVVWGDTQFVAVGASGTVVISRTGESWQKISSGSTEYLKSIAYGKGTYVAIRPPLSGWGYTLVSGSGITWRAYSYQSKEMDYVAFGNNVFVAVSSNGAVHYASDGTLWDSRSLSEYTPLTEIQFVNNHFAAVGSNGDILFSPNGSTWTYKTTTIYPYDLYTVLHTGSRFVCTGIGGYAFTSTDGSQWVKCSVAPSVVFVGAASGNNRCVLVGGELYGAGIIATTENYTAWTYKSFKANTPFKAVAYGSGKFVAVGNGGTVYLSGNGVDWQPCVTPTSYNLSGVAFSDSMFVATTDNGAIMFSPDGQNWTRDSAMSTKSPWITGIAGGKNKFIIATGTSAYLTISKQQNAWAITKDSMAPSMRSIMFSDSQFIGSNASEVLISDDGSNWKKYAVSTTKLNCATYANGSYVAVGRGGSILLSHRDGYVAAHEFQKSNKLQHIAVKYTADGIVLRIPRTSPAPRELIVYSLAGKVIGRYRNPALTDQLLIKTHKFTKNMYVLCIKSQSGKTEWSQIITIP